MSIEVQDNSETIEVKVFKLPKKELGVEKSLNDIVEELKQQIDEEE
jgi:hypothetical protein